MISRFVIYFQRCLFIILGVSLLLASNTFADEKIITSQARLTSITHKKLIIHNNILNLVNFIFK
jgi:hypothetical protein